MNEKLKNESWVRIMQNDTSVNYFEANKDFAKFRKQHAKEEAREQKRLERKGVRVPNEPHLENKEELIMNSFVKWSRSMKPFVSEDGKIMPLEKRLELMNNKND